MIDEDDFEIIMMMCISTAMIFMWSSIAVFWASSLVDGLLASAILGENFIKESKASRRSLEQTPKVL